MAKDFANLRNLHVEKESDTRQMLIQCQLEELVHFNYSQNAH